MIRGSAKRPTVRWLLALSLLLFVVTGLWAASESWNGIQPVSSTLNGISVPMFFVLVALIVIAFATRSSKARWGTSAVVAGTALIVILAGFGAYGIYRGNTAAGRFADDIDRFPVPTGFEFDAEATAAETADPDQTQYAVRVWKGGQTLASECPAVAKAFKDWKVGPDRPSSDPTTCTLASSEDYRNIRLELKGNVLILEMWLDRSSAFTF